MLNALQTLIDHGCSEDAIKRILNEVIGADGFDDDNDKRCCIAMLYDYENGNKHEAAGYSISYDNVVDAPGAEYLVLDDDEADVACQESIEDSLWAFRPSFLSSMTSIDESVFEALADKCEDANDAVRSIINGSCGIDSFVESAIGADGRGHFLGHYDGEENEISVDGAEYYVYRQN